MHTTIGYWCDEDGAVMPQRTATHYAVLYEDERVGLNHPRNISRAWLIVAL